MSDTWGIRGSCSRKIPIERRRRDTKALRDLSDGDVGVSEHRLGGLDVILGEFRRTAAGTAKAPRGGQTRLGTLPDQAALKFRQCPQGSRIKSLWELTPLGDDTLRLGNGYSPQRR